MRFTKYLLTAIFLAAFLGAPLASAGAVDVAVSVDLFAPPPVAIAPPPLPVYVVPPPPMDGYIWAPGHWRWADYGYFWVPGTWVQPPVVGVLWTPGYWGWSEGAFLWHEGYWGPHVGFYGGVNYGGGYGGNGFVGGRWNHGVYAVDRGALNVAVVAGASFNGGPGGTTLVMSARDSAFQNEHHYPPTEEQVAHVRAASTNPAFAAHFNHGKPNVAATPRAGVFTGAGVVAARQAGARNMAAESHNTTIRQNPTASKGAMPRAETAGAPRAGGQGGARPEAGRPEGRPEGAHPEGERPGEPRGGEHGEHPESGHDEGRHE